MLITDLACGADGGHKLALILGARFLDQRILFRQSSSEIEFSQD